MVGVRQSAWPEAAGWRRKCRLLELPPLFFALMGSAPPSRASMRSWMSRAIVALALVPVAASHAAAQARIALLIGNQNYAESIGTLASPHADVAVLGAKLAALGFRVTLVRDAGYKTMATSIARHAEAVRRAGKALSFIYYSGHGAADLDARVNYLIPVDVPN